MQYWEGIMHIKNKRGQSTVEYVLLVTAVVAVMIAFVTNNKTGLQAQLNTTLLATTNEINNVGQSYTGSHTLSNPTADTQAGVPSGYTVNPTQ